MVIHAKVISTRCPPTSEFRFPISEVRKESETRLSESDPPATARHDRPGLG